RGRRRTRNGAATFGIEPATLELRDEVGEARLVALELGEAVLRLARLRAVAAQRGLVTRLELSQVGQLLRLLAAQPLQLLLVLPQLALLHHELLLEPADVVHEPAVVRSDEVQVLVSVEQVAEALRAEQDAHGVQRASL